MSDVNTKTMNRQELEAAATDLGLQFPHNISDEKLRVKIDEALGNTSSSTTSTPPATTQNTPPAGENEPDPELDPEPEANAERRFEIIIATNEQDKQPVPVGVNGKTWLIKRGSKVIVPESVVGILETAVQHSYDPKTMERTDLQAYPFQIVREIQE